MFLNFFCKWILTLLFICLKEKRKILYIIIYGVRNNGYCTIITFCTMIIISGILLSNHNLLMKKMDCRLTIYYYMCADLKYANTTYCLLHDKLEHVHHGLNVKKCALMWRKYIKEVYTKVIIIELKLYEHCTISPRWRLEEFGALLQILSDIYPKIQSFYSLFSFFWLPYFDNRNYIYIYILQLSLKSYLSFNIFPIFSIKVGSFT